MALKRLERNNAFRASANMITSYLLPTSNIFERLFSIVRHTHTNRRQDISQSHFEKLLFLCMNIEYSGVKNVKAVYESKSAVQGLTSVQSISTTNKELFSKSNICHVCQGYNLTFYLTEFISVMCKYIWRRKILGNIFLFSKCLIIYYLLIDKGIVLRAFGGERIMCLL